MPGLRRDDPAGARERRATSRPAAAGPGRHRPGTWAVRGGRARARARSSPRRGQQVRRQREARRRPARRRVMGRWPVGVARILREYRLAAVSVRRRYGSVSDTRVGYEFRQRGGRAVLVRAYRADMPLAEHFGGSGAMSVTAWLQGRAATLGWLAAHGYPAPRLVPERTGDPVGVAGPWLTMAATFVPGRALARGQLGLLGAALGRLHALPAPPAYPMLEPEPGPGRGSGAGPRAAGPGLASWHPEAIPAALSRLDAVTALLPGEWRPLHEQFRATLLAIQRAAPGLPRAVVQGDAWPGNAVVTPDGRAALIDWENGGLGLPVVDLGNCLLESHLDPGLPAGQPASWLIQPDPRRIAAVLDGY